MKFTIRRLNAQDAESFRKIRLEGLKKFPAAFGSSYEEESVQDLQETIDRFNNVCNKPNNFLLGAFQGDSLVGTIGIFPDETFKRKHKVTIWGMYVQTEFQKHGIGRSLLRRMIAEVQNLPGVSRIELAVESGNIPAKALYTSLGFRKWGTEPDAAIIGSETFDEDYMSLDLAMFKPVEAK